MDLDLLKQVCLLINTADYCQTTAYEVRPPQCILLMNSYLFYHQLEEKVKEKVNPEFKEKITFQVECDLFVRCILQFPFMV